jgi:hypothetical protein
MTSAARASLILACLSCMLFISAFAVAFVLTDLPRRGLLALLLGAAGCGSAVNSLVFWRVRNRR